MLIRFWFGRLHIGRTSGIGNRAYDASVSWCWGWRGDVPPTEPSWRTVMRFAWNWLPVRKYKSLCPTTLLPPSADVLLKAAMIGKEGEWLKVEDKRGIDSSRWTGRHRKFAGFGPWNYEFRHYRATWRSLMHVYLTGAKERANPHHIMYVAPGSPDAGTKAAECPSEWKNDDGTPRNFEVVFAYGRASVDEQLGKWLVESGHAKRSNIVRAASGSMLGSLAKTIAGR